MLCCIMDAAKTVKVAKRPTPAARPSRPSTRLKAFMQASSQRMVSGMFHQAIGSERRRSRGCARHPHRPRPPPPAVRRSLIQAAQVEQVVQQSDRRRPARRREAISKPATVAALAGCLLPDAPEHTPPGTKWQSRSRPPAEWDSDGPYARHRAGPPLRRTGTHPGKWGLVPGK